MSAIRAENLMARVSDRLAQAGFEPRMERHGISAGCPGCRGRTLTLRSDERGVLLKCSAGCDERKILEALGLRPEQVRMPATGAVRALPSARSGRVERGAPAVHREGARRATLLVERASDVRPEAVRWLWPGRIPLGKLTLLEGQPGLGKTLVALDVVARVSSGASMPLSGAAQGDGPRTALVLSYEDDPRDTIRPRLDAAGAHCDRIHLIRGTLREPTGEGPVVLPEDLAPLEEKIRELGAVLVMVDPLMAALSGEIDAHRDQDVRRALSVMRNLAEATGAAFLLIRHLRKAPASSAVLAGQGSIGIVGAARTAHLVAADPDDPEARILAPVKSNVGQAARALRFRVGIRTSAAGIEAPFVEWLGESDATANELVFTAEPQAAGALAEAAAFLRAELAARPKPAKDVRAAAEAAGVAWRSVERAKERAGVEVRKAGFSGGWEWALTTSAATNTARGGTAAAFAKTATEPPAQTLGGTAKTAKPAEDRQAKPRGRGGG